MAARIAVTRIADIPDLGKKVNGGKVTYRGLGVGKLASDFHELTGDDGVRIKVDGKEYFITDTDYRKLDWDFENEKWFGKIRFSAPFRKFGTGGSIPNNYEGKTAEEIWDAWTLKQKEHFILDHNIIDFEPDNNGQFTHDGFDRKKSRWKGFLKAISANDPELKNPRWEDLHKELQESIREHIEMGQYGTGGCIPDNKRPAGFKRLSPAEKNQATYKGKIYNYNRGDGNWYPVFEGNIPNNYSGKTAKEVWTEWTLNQREYFIQDHFSTEDGATRLGKTFEDKADELLVLPFDNLPTVVKDELRNHIHEGQYGGGGSISDYGIIGYIVTDGENLNGVQPSEIGKYKKSQIKDIVYETPKELAGEDKLIYKINARQFYSNLIDTKNIDDYIKHYEKRLNHKNDGIYSAIPSLRKSHEAFLKMLKFVKENPKAIFGDPYFWKEKEAANKMETGGSVISSHNGIFNNTVLKSIFGF